MICKIGVLKYLENSLENTCVGVFLYGTPPVPASLPTRIKKEFKCLNVFQLTLWHSINYRFNKLINLIIDLSILFEIFQSYIENARSNNKKSNNLETCSQNFTVDFGRGIMSIIVFWLW